jgi:hypothetical protein
VIINCVQKFFKNSRNSNFPWKFPVDYVIASMIASMTRLGLLWYKLERKSGISLEGFIMGATIYFY